MTEDSYAAAWRYFRRVRGTAFLLWAGILPLGFVLQFLLRRDVPRVLVMALFVAYLVAIVVANLLLATWKCPRCGRVFAYNPRTTGGRVWIAYCGHCGLEVGAEAAADAGASPV